MSTPADRAAGTLTFGRKKPKGVRKARETEYLLSRFDPLLYDIIEELARNQLSQEDYPYVRPPTEADDFGSAPDTSRVASARTNRPCAWWG
jgi:syntaxin-binding protein 1